MFDDESARPALNISDYWQIVCRRRWWLIGSFFACWLISWAVGLLMPSVYRSDTLILVEPQKVPEQYVVANVNMDLQDRLQSMTQQILSRTRLERIINTNHLYEDLRQRLGPDGLVEQMRKDIQIQLVEAPGKRQLTAFRVSYSAPNAAMAQKVATQLTSLFIDEEIQEQSQLSESTTQFLSTELESARASLAQQESKIKEFKARYLGELPSQLESNVHMLSVLQDRYRNLGQRLNQAEQQKLYLESMANQYRSVRVGGDQVMTTMPALEKELAKLKADLTDAETRYTDKHPDVIQLKGRIAEIERVKKGLEASLAKVDAAKPPISPSEMQAISPLVQLEGQLKANAQDVADTRKEIAVVEGQVNAYQGRLNQTPIREQQLADLTRDYDQSKSNYDSLLKKQMQSQLATNLEKRQQGKGFRILDPPSLPQKPYSPDRLRISVIGLLGGIILALGMTFLTEFVDDRIRSEDEINRMVSVRVLAGIPHLVTPSEEHAHRRRRILEWCSATLMTVVVVGANLYTFYRG
jgi:polysaccharide chain length determinant protein (PEP-CTERM system associated)